MFAKLRERLKGWKTIIANVMVGLPAAALYLYTEFGNIDFTAVIPAQYVGLFVFCNAVLGVFLRFITTGPVGSKSELVPPIPLKAGD